MGKLLANIRRERLDRFFVGTHGKTTREQWYEAGHFIKGVTYAAKRITETDGDKNERGNCGFLVDIAGELAQNTWTDLEFYDTVMNGKRNVAIVTGKGPKVLLRIFRIIYKGGGQWQDNRISIVTDDQYNSAMDKAQMKAGGWVLQYERYTASDVKIVSGKLTFKTLEGSVDTNPFTDLGNGS